MVALCFSHSGRMTRANAESRSFPLEIPGLDLRSIPE
jgi:hypothetical protein